MAEYRQNADWSESDHPRDDDGKFTDKQSKFDKQQSEKEKLASKFRDTDGKPKSNGTQVKLSRQEYEVARLARTKKYDKYRLKGVPNYDYVYAGNSFVMFQNLDRDNFVIRVVLDIEQDGDIIKEYTRDIKWL